MGWLEFRSSGLLYLVNTGLHLVGVALVLEADQETGEIVQAYPARIHNMRGFTRRSMWRNVRLFLLWLRSEFPRLLEELDVIESAEREEQKEVLRRVERAQRAAMDLGYACVYPDEDGAIVALDEEGEESILARIEDVHDLSPIALWGMVETTLRAKAKGGRWGQEKK